MGRRGGVRFVIGRGSAGPNLGQDAKDLGMSPTLRPSRQPMGLRAVKIKRVDLQSMWPDPAAALPVWLAENVDVLGDEAGLPLTKPVGDGDPRSGVIVPLLGTRDSAVVFATTGAFDETMIGVA